MRRETAGTRGRKILSYLKKHLGDIRKLKVIEVGAGAGVYSLILAKYGASVALLDYSREALALARNHFDSAGLSADFICADALKPEAGILGEFDAAMSFGTIEHYRYPQRLSMAQAHLALVKKYGVVVISVPNRWFLPHEILKFYLQKRRKWHLGYEGAFTRMELFRLGKKLSLENKEIHGSGLITDILRYLDIIGRTRFLHRFFPAFPKNEIVNGPESHFDDLFGADIFLMGQK